MVTGLTGDITPSMMLISFGYLCVMFVGACLLYQLVRLFKSMADTAGAQSDRDNKYLLFEETMVDKFASEKGIDLKKEQIIKNEMKGLNRKTFHKVVSEELIKRVSSEKK